MHAPILPLLSAHERVLSAHERVLSLTTALSCGTDDVRAHKDGGASGGEAGEAGEASRAGERAVDSDGG